MEEKYENILSAHGIRSTANRISVLKALSQSKSALSIAELELILDTIDKSNIFRTLTTFKEAKLVHLIADESNSIKYELCRSEKHEDDDSHVHFFCYNCQHTYCIPETKIPYIKLPKGYKAEYANFVINGLCDKCTKTK